MRVLHVVDTNGLGGAQTLLHGFVGHPSTTTEHHVFALRRKVEDVLATSPGIEVAESSSRFSLSPRKRLRELLSPAEFGIVHCHLPRSQLFVWSLRSFLNNTTRVIAHEHGQILGSNDQRLLTDLSYLTMKRLTRSFFRHHIAVSNATREGLIKRAGIVKEDITVIGSFANTDEYNPEERRSRRDAQRAALNIKEDDFVVGIAGRITAKKGWRVFLDALHCLAKSGNVPVAVVSGHGPERSEFEAAVAALPTVLRLHDLRWVDDVRDFYSTLDCFVAPSFAEGSPVAAREAMAMGLPIVASNIEGFTDLITNGDSGLLFRTGDSGALAECIERVMADSALSSELGRRAAEHSKSFSVAAYTQMLDNVYAQVLQQSR
jgi:glycosyltransferase involved in cell wall biosynthesis